jgi:hypothetical protein
MIGRAAAAPATDAAVANIARACRAAALSTEGTYQLSLLITFFDRLGHRSDRLLVQFLTLRLLSGQLADGTWGYTCPGLKLDPVQQAQLEAELGREAKLHTPARTPEPSRKGGQRQDLDDTPRPAGKDEPKGEEKEPVRLHPSLERLARQLPAAPAEFGAVGDHSNTQFATVGLWVGRRHAVDVSAALAKIDQHYRACQAPDGGWSYTQAFGGPSSPAMTCAGLMGLAIGFGAKNLPADRGAAPRVDTDALNKDPAVTAGLKYLGAILAAGRQPDAGTGSPLNPLSADLYFMWSLERVGMVYGLKSIGNVDWYEWGSRLLVATQQRDGSWLPTNHVPSPDVATAFALLFLGRANLTEDLSNSLKGKVKDPGTSRLIRTKDLDAVLEGAAKASAGSRGSTGSKRTDGAAAKQPRTDTPAASADPSGRLAKALVEAGPGERAGLVEKYRETKGGEYTDALARAAGQLAGEAQVQVRDALAQRLTRMKPTTLIELMADRDRELRRAAALACGSKGKERLPEFADALIRLVADEDPLVAQAARASLKTLTDQDFGPPAGAAAGDRVKALTAWRKWWDERNQ